jgi:hypothetical protein
LFRNLTHDEAEALEGKMFKALDDLESAHGVNAQFAEAGQFADSPEVNTWTDTFDVIGDIRADQPHYLVNYQDGSKEWVVP